MKDTSRHIDDLVGWEKNPRTISESDKERLKKQLLRLKQYKPLLGVEEGGKVVILGGNMRLEAIRDLVKEGHDEFEDVWVSIVDAPDEKMKLEYALSDNDRAGSYDEKMLGSLVRSVDDFPVQDYYVDIGSPIMLDTIIGFGEAEDVNLDESRLHVLRVLPPETPSIKEKAIIKFNDFDDYEKVKKAIEGGKITSESLLSLL